MKNLPGLVLLAVLLIGASFTSSLAQTDPGKKLLEEREEAARKKRLSDSSGGLETSQDQKFLPVAEAQCFPIVNIQLRGVTIFDQQFLENLLSNFANRCLGQVSISNLTAAITSAYVEAGYITTRAYIPAQDVSSKNLVVDVLEGRIAAYVYRQVDKEGVPKPGKVKKIRSAFPSQAGEIFQIRDVEHGLEQINRLPSSNANANLVPGNAPGTSVVVITEQKQDLVRGTFGIDNKGTGASDTRQLRLGLELDDLIGINDMFSFSYSGSETTNALAASASMPYRKWLFSGSASYSESLSVLSATSDLFTQTTSMSLKAERLLSRNAKGKYYGYFSLGRYTNDRFINIVALTPQKRASYNFGLRFEKYFTSSVLSADIKLSYGAGFWGADTDPVGIVSTTPHAGFSKIGGQVSWQKSNQNGMTFTSSGFVQYADVALFSNEQISIGGWDTIRGYAGFGLAGDAGIYVRNELTFAQPKGPTSLSLWKPNRFFDKAFGGNQLTARRYAFFDFGTVRQVSTSSTTGLAGLGLGISANVGRISFGAEAAMPLISAAGQTKGEFQGQIYATIKLF